VRALGAYGFGVAAERILLVEDDERIGSTLLRALTGNGYVARWEQTGGAGVAAARADTPGLVLLDLGLPDVDGLDVCRQIHIANPLVDIIMLTARADELDIVIGLDAGAVDYITKPFKLAELMARIRAQLRRSEPRTPAVATGGGVTVDTNSRRVWVADTEVDLRAKEFDLLARLVASANEVVTRETLMAEVWDEHWFGSTKTLDFHISALRRKIDDDDQPSRITTLRGVGYRFEAP
jgi:DNA-binding response OmpR family regulator